MAQCCPSRVSMLTGRCGHNTNITSVIEPYGGYSKFVRDGWNDHYLPVWLQDAGYNTYYVGKLMNGHNVTNYNSPYPKGWTGSEFLLEPSMYIYYNSSFQRNQEPPRNFPGEYSTDLVSDRSVSFLQHAADAKKPFFLTVAPIGPHTENIFPSQPGTAPLFNPPVPADRHKGLYKDARVPRTANFNPSQISGVGYYHVLQQWNDSVIDYFDEFYRLRLRSLAAVDELVDAVFAKLESLGLLDNTYVIYTSDNGYHIGQHRLAPGKTCAWEEDVRVPFFIRGPNMNRNVTVDKPTSHTDLAPTIFNLAGIPLHDDFDGAPIPIHRGDNVRPKVEHINIEFWGPNYGEGDYPQPETMTNNTYKALRIVSEQFDLIYTVWCTNGKELYDMTTDSGQMNNIHSSFADGANIANFPVSQLETRLDALMMVLKSCKGQAQCMTPWGVLHPQGDVSNLMEAMDGSFDEFYAKQPKVSYSSCQDGYIIEVEGHQMVTPFE